MKRFCAECGKELPEGSMFCPECGTKLADLEERVKRFCSECGMELPEGVKFCRRCGTKVADFSEVESNIEEEKIVNSREIYNGINSNYVNQSGEKLYTKDDLRKANRKGRKKAVVDIIFAPIIFGLGFIIFIIIIVCMLVLF